LGGYLALWPKRTTICIVVNEDNVAVVVMMGSIGSWEAAWQIRAVNCMNDI
jgi:hypothetical protein